MLEATGRQLIANTVHGDRNAVLIQIDSSIVWQSEAGFLNMKFVMTLTICHMHLHFIDPETTQRIGRARDIPAQDQLKGSRIGAAV